MLEKLGIPLAKTQGFADHQAFDKAQLAQFADSQTPLLMTEKDAVNATILHSQIGGMCRFLQHFQKNRPLVC